MDRQIMICENGMWSSMTKPDSKKKTKQTIMPLDVAFTTPPTGFTSSSLNFSSTTLNSIKTIKQSRCLRLPIHHRARIFSPQCCTPSSSSSSSSGSKIATTHSIFSSTALGEELFSKYVHPTPKGTAELALSRNLPLDGISSTYGHIMAATALDDIPSKNSLNKSILTSSLREFLSSTDMQDTKLDLTKLSKLMTIACDATTELNSEQVEEFSKLYAKMLSSSIKLSGMEMNSECLCTAFESRLLNDQVPFPMSSREEYDDAFVKLQDCVTHIKGNMAIAAADEFFKTHLQSNQLVRDVEGDGYILAFNHDADIDDSHVIDVRPNSVVSFAIRVRLLDGRCVMDENDIEIDIETMPGCLTSALIGMKLNTKHTVFYHPYAAHDVVPLFLTPEQTPSQPGLVIDFSPINIQ